MVNMCFEWANRENRNCPAQSNVFVHTCHSIQNHYPHIAHIIYLIDDISPFNVNRLHFPKGHSDRFLGAISGFCFAFLYISAHNNGHLFAYVCIIWLTKLKIYSDSNRFEWPFYPFHMVTFHMQITASTPTHTPSIWTMNVKPFISNKEMMLIPLSDWYWELRIDSTIEKKPYYVRMF